LALVENRALEGHDAVLDGNLDEAPCPGLTAQLCLYLGLYLGIRKRGQFMLGHERREGAEQVRTRHDADDAAVFDDRQALDVSAQHRFDSNPQRVLRDTGDSLGLHDLFDPATM